MNKKNIEAQTRGIIEINLVCKRCGERIQVETSELIDFLNNLIPNTPGNNFMDQIIAIPKNTEIKDKES
jgi:hypothetical protein